MDFDGGWDGWPREERRRPSLWHVFAAGLGGVLAGALLLYFFLIHQGAISQPGNLPGEQKEPLPAEEGAAAEVVSRVIPAVVAVNCYVQSPFDQSQLIKRGSGSGAVISADGYIITNQHVIDGAAKVVVVTTDYRSFEAKIVGEDKLTDLALLKIEANNLRYIPLGNSDAVQVGETVLAVGNPLGFLRHTVTRGIISALEREVRTANSQYAYTYIQTDAVINPGNSGGPLVNLKGEVIGINSAKISGAEGIGLAIPVNTVKRVAEDLKREGRVRRPYLGIWVENLPESLLPRQGVNIREVIAGGAAEAAGIKAGDVIVAVGRRRSATWPSFSMPS